MPDYDSPQGGGSPDEQNVQLATQTIDVLVRNLELAKAQLDSAQDDAAFPDTICSLIYGHEGTFCPLLYLHFPTVVKAADD